MKVVAIVGPTAVGKTALSLDIAEAIGGEIVSVDSRQVYRYMDVGTDKVSQETRKKILHHLIDVADPDENFTVARFVELCGECVPRILSRGRIPLFVGGTPFYYQALFSPTLTDGLPRDSQVRAKYEQAALDYGNETLHSRLREIDAITADKLHFNDVRRVSRALEIFELTGRAPSEIFSERGRASSNFDVLYIGLNRLRSLLFERIAERVSFQFHNGYPEEVEWLIKNGFDEKFPSMQGFGYRELASYVRGKSSFEDALEGDIRNTKAFCRRQMTWFTKFSPIVWYDLDEISYERLKLVTIENCLRHARG